MFRADRIDSLVELDEPAAAPAEAISNDVTEGVFQADPDSTLVTLRVGRANRWITEYYPCESVTEVTAEEWLVNLRVNDLDWARRLVLGLGPQVAVVAPQALLDNVRRSVAEAIASYA